MSKFETEHFFLKSHKISKKDMQNEFTLEIENDHEKIETQAKEITSFDHTITFSSLDRRRHRDRFLGSHQRFLSEFSFARTSDVAIRQHFSLLTTLLGAVFALEYGREDDGDRIDEDSREDDANPNQIDFYRRLRSCRCDRWRS